MAKTADRVKETTTSTGTGTVNLGGASTGFRAFSDAFSSADSVLYCIAGGTEWEVGIGTVTSGSPWTLSRTTVLSSSNSGSLVSFSSGTKDVFATLPGDLALGAPASNAIINGCGAVNQYGNSSGASGTIDDGAYGIDRWIVISAANDDVALDVDSATVPDDVPTAIKLTVQASGANHQFGLVQILSNEDTLDFVSGAYASFRVSARASGLGTLRACLLGWTGTADQCTRDVVSSWAGGGTEPTWATSWSRQGSIYDLSLSTSYQELIAEAQAVGGTVKNLALVCWIDDTDAANTDTLRISRVGLYASRVLPPWVRRPLADEISECWRFSVAYNRGNLQTSVAYYNVPCVPSRISSTTTGHGRIALPRRLAIPANLKTDGFYSGAWLVSSYAGSLHSSLTLGALLFEGPNVVQVAYTGTSLTQGASPYFGTNNDASAYLHVQAEVGV